MVCGACSTYLLLCQVCQAALAPCSSVAVLSPIRTVPARTSPLQTEARCRQHVPAFPLENLPVSCGSMVSSCKQLPPPPL